jgi:hypothetical protein
VAAAVVVASFNPAECDEPRAGPDWWSLRPVVRPAVPAIARDGASTWIRTPVDAFVLQRLQREGLAPSPEAGRAILIRRATFDLLGLPPTPEEVDAFVTDPSPDAFDKLIDRILASPRYGERWARHWLDVARFGESQGFERDIIRDHAWRYRDYVIECLNNDHPYDQFVREQIAGDVLEPIRSRGIIATGFLVGGAYDEAGNSSKSELLRARIREEELEDIVGTVGQTFLGLTVNCARCHDHKFDPIPQRDYYRLKAVFDGVRHGNRPTLPPSELKEHQDQVAKLNESIAALEMQIAELEGTARNRLLANAQQDRDASRDVSGLAPQPMARWTFESDLRDQAGNLHGTLHGGAKLARGKLRLNGKDAFVNTAPLTGDLQAKTLEVWATMPNLEQRGGGLISIESTADPGAFDSVVYGEREPKKWIAGSEQFRRTKDLAAAMESAAIGELVHIAIVYDVDDRISVYRNGTPYARPYVPTGPDATLRTYPANYSRVLLGLRHTGAENGFFSGEIEEARLYDRALAPAEVAASYRRGVTSFSTHELVAALTIDERALRTSQLDQLERLRNSLRAINTLPQVYAANPRPPLPTHLLLRGDVEKRGDLVTPGALSRIACAPGDFGLPPDASEAMRRQQLAEWIAQPANPLTARVMVNRIWHYHFGHGIASSPSDLGWNGDRPSHPELLDWLASEFVDCGWSIKALHKLIMMSSTYQQSSQYAAEAAARDSDDRLLWRFPPRRLEGEAVRDAMLAVSGQLNTQMGGPSFRPFELRIFNSHFYDLNDPVGPEFNRRTVYRINVNSAKDPLLESMDCPDPSTTTPRRNVTTTPIQALGLMNNSFVLRQARHFADRLGAQAGDQLADQVALAYRLALGRNPSQPETARAVELAQNAGMPAITWALFNASEFQYLK